MAEKIEIIFVLFCVPPTRKIKICSISIPLTYKDILGHIQKTPANRI